MAAIAASKVLVLNFNSFRRYHRHRHRHHHRFVCYIQSRGNQQLKLVTSEETHIVKPPVLKVLTPKPKPKPKPKRIPKLVELTVQGLLLTAIVGSGWIYNVILPKTYDDVMIPDVELSSGVAYAYTSGEYEILIFAMMFSILKLSCIHEDACLTNRKNCVTFKVLGVFLICAFVGCSLRLVSLAYVRDTLLSSRGHGPWHLILVLFFIVLNISLCGVSVIQDIRNLEDRINTQICVGSGAQVGDLKSRKRSRRPRKKSRRRGIILLNKHLGRVSGRRPRKKSGRGGTIVLNKDLGKTTPVVQVFDKKAIHTSSNLCYGLPEV